MNIAFAAQEIFPSMVGSDEPQQLRVLSFNVWGLKFLSKARLPRIRAIAEYLSSSSYDIVCLQEIWIYKEFELIRDAVAHILPNSRFFHTGALGSGLAIFTRFPIVASQALPFSLSGTPQQPFDGDFFVNKAAGMVVIRHPVLGETEIWNTHMHAAGENPPDTRQAHRIAQAWQLANQIRSGAAKGRYIIVTGDFNSQPFSVPVAIMRSHGGLSDSFLDAHPGANDVHPPVSPEDALQHSGMSCDSPLNTWSHGKPIPGHITAQGGKRLDYIFYRQPAPAVRRPVYPDRPRSSRSHAEAHSPEQAAEDIPILRCSASEIVLTDIVPGQSYSYSDHFGLFSTFVVDQTGSSAALDRTKDADTRPTSTEDGDRASYRRLISPIDYQPTGKTDVAGESTASLSYAPSASASTRQPDSSHLDTPQVIRSAIVTLTAYTALSRRTAKLHLRICAVSLILLVALAVGSAWQPKSYIQPIFTVVAGAIGAVAATTLYFGFLWGRWEEGLLMETLEQMDIELKTLISDSR